VVVNPDGSFTYTPTAGATGTDTFSYQVSDGQLVSGPAPVTLNLHAQTQTPIAVVAALNEWLAGQR
jgi:Bacterial Ig domain